MTVPPDSRFTELVSETSIELMRAGQEDMTLVIDLGRVNEAELKVLENQNMKGVPIWWDKPIYVAFIVWVPDSMVVVPVGVMTSYDGELVVAAKVQLTAKEFNKLVHFGRIVKL